MQDSTTHSIFNFSLEEAQNFDAQDTLKNYRNRFYIPLTKTGEHALYFCGNSLGLQPKSVKDYLQEELDDWARLGVDGHTHAKHPWMPYHEFLTEKMAKVVGAKPVETVIMNTLTANLHFMMVSFYRPTQKRFKILIEADAFPSDRYAVASQAEFHGYDPKEAILEWKPSENQSTLDYESLEALLKKHGDTIALVMIGAVNYYTGQFFDLKRIVQLAKSYGCMVGFDAAHGAGNVELDLHQAEADFCVWCSYKYLNSGPGSLAGCFVHERHAKDKNITRFEGWWGH
ncbi:MAG: kynureninase, partial [Flavobacteriaceae bacterium]|nr:kynureninase [Flavobacteriaceae bacterium]